MDLAKVRSQLKNLEMYAKDIEKLYPKSRNAIGSILWCTKAIRDEVEKPDTVVVEEKTDTTEK